MSTYTVYEIVTKEEWSDKACSGRRVVRFKTTMPLPVALRSDIDFLFGLFSEYQPASGKTLASWGRYAEGAIALGNIDRMISVEE